MKHLVLGYAGTIIFLLYNKVGTFLKYFIFINKNK